MIGRPNGEVLYMIGRSIIGLALLVYLGVVFGCMLPSGHSATTHAVQPVAARQLVGEPYRGVAMQIQRPDWMDQYKKAIDEIVALGADTFLCIVDARQENGGSAKIYLDLRMTPTVEQLGDLINYAKARKLRVILMPIVLLDAPRGNEWRGTIDPAKDNGGWEAWFDSYRDMMVHFAHVAESYKADMMVVGSELVSSEVHAEQWSRTIKSIRDIYRGFLTYSSNWDHYLNIPFWDQLDVIGMNSYWKLGEDRTAKTEEIVRNWKEIQKSLTDFSRKKGKKIVLLEAGWCSLANAAHEPWDYTKTTEPIDLDLQKRLWEGFFEAWQGHPIMAGFMVWAWAPNDGGSEDKGYTPKGKPAYEVIRQWMGKPWQQP